MSLLIKLIMMFNGSRGAAGKKTNLFHRLNSHLQYGVCVCVYVAFSVFDPGNERDHVSIYSLICSCV